MVGMSPQTLGRWLLGYDHGRRDEERRHEKPLWQPQYAPDDDEGVLLGFRDLVEAAQLFGD